MPKPKKINLDKLHKLLEVKRGVEAMRQDLVNRTEFVIPKVGIDYFTPEEQKAWFDAISEYVDKLFVEQSTEFFSPETLEDIKTLVLNDVVKLIKDGKDGKDGKDAVVDYDSIIGRVVSELDLPDYEKLIERTVKKIDSIEEKTKTFASKEEVEQIKEEVKSLEINLNQRINLAPRTAGGGSNVTVKLNGALVGSGTILDFSGSGVSSITHNGNTASINISGGGAGVSDGDKGDITVSGSGTTWTIDNLAVTNAKINDVAWSKVSGTPTTLAGYGISDTKANFNSALSDGDFLFSGDITQYTDEMAQDAVGGMVANSTFVNLAYVDGTPSLTASLSATGTPSASTFLRGDNTWASISASPGGSDTQLQYNSSGSFAGISGATSNGTNVTFGTGNLLVQDVKASGSGGVAIKNNSGTTVADFGAGSSTNISLVGAVNMGTGSADYAQYSGGTGVVTNTATGSSTNIDITVVPKGTGKFKVTGDANISGLTASQILATNASKDLVSLSTATYPDLTELSYVKGVTSSIQTQLGNKQPLDTQLTSLAALSYTGNGGKFIRLNAGETDFELATVSGGQTLYECVVAPSGGDYTTLGDALAAGKTRIFIRNGTYSETGENTLGTAYIVGESRDGVIIDVDGTTNDRFLLGNGSLEIRNVTFQGPANGTDYLLEATSTRTKGHFLLDNVRLKFGGVSLTNNTTGDFDFAITNSEIDCGASSSSGIKLYDSGTVGARKYKRILITGSKIQRNFSPAASTGALIEVVTTSPEVTITDNQMFDGQSNNHNYYVYVSGSSTVTFANVSNNVLGFQGASYGIYVDSVLYAAINGNVIDTHGSGSGIYLSSTGSSPQAASVINGNNIAATNTYGIELGNNTKYVTISGNTIYNSSTGGIRFNGTGNNYINISGNSFFNPQSGATFLSGTKGEIIHVDKSNFGIRSRDVRIIQRMKNTSGGSLAAGDVVVFKSVAAGDEVTTTTTGGDSTVFGMSLESISNNSYGHFLVEGFTNLLKVNGTTDIAIGDAISTYTSAGVSKKASAGETSFATALEAYTTDDSSGVIDAIIKSPITLASSGGVGDMVLADVQSVTGLKTFDKDKLAMKGTSTGVTTISTANTGASNYTATLQAATGTLALTSDIPSLSGYVNTSGTPANNQIAIFTDADTVEGDSSLTYDGTSFNLATAKNFQIAGATILADAAGTTTLSNIDALDATTEATIESAIDTLANLTSIQGRTVTLADAGADAIFGWDDSANQYANLSAADVRTALGLATTDSPQFTAINLGHASDTTLARVSAGVVSVEGKTLVNLTDGGTFLADISVPDEAYGSGWNASLEVPTKNAVYDKIETLLPLAGGTMTGNITLGENTSIALDPAGSADGKYSGITVTGTAGAALAFGDVVVLDVTDSRWELADANSAASADGDARGMIGICVLAAAGDGSATTILLQGIIRADAAFPALTVGAPVYLSETAGDVTLTKPTTTDAVVRTLGFALTADEMYWNPSSDYITVV